MFLSILLRFGVPLAFFSTVLGGWMSPDLATSLTSLFQQILDALRDNAEKSELLLKLLRQTQENKDLENLDEVWTFYRLFTVLWLYYKWRSSK